MTLDAVTPIARLTGDALVVVVPANSPHKSIKDLAAALKADTSKVVWAGGSAGGADHILAGLVAHLADGGEGWLIISDIAELLGLRSREQLLKWIAEAGLKVIGRLNTRPKHPKAQDASDPLHAARAAEVTSLWRLGKKKPA